MEDFSQFPCQLTHPAKDQPESWALDAFTVDLELQHDRKTDREFKTCTNLAFARLIWEFTGDASVRCLIVTRQRQSLEHSACTLDISTTATVEDALRNITRSERKIPCGTPAAPSALVHLSNGANVPSQKPLGGVPLQILCVPGTEALQAQFLVRYDKASIHPFHAQRYGWRLATLVKAIWLADNSDIVADLATLEADDEDFIRSFNSGPQEIDFRTIHDCVSQVAARHPHRAAIDAWDGHFSRQELENASNRLASTLIGAGVKRGSIVSIMLDKSKWTAVSMLAVLKAGAAFLFLEPTLPFERLQVMIDKTRCTYAVTSRQHTSLACSLISQVITIDGHGDFWEVDKTSTSQCTSQSQRLPKVSPEDAAFLIFTSGSSGIPKAIVTQHFAWVTGYTQHVHKFGITEGSRVFQCASYSFVVSTLDTISTLLVGGTVCIPGSDERINDLENAVRRLRPDYICMTPSVAKVVSPARVPSIKTLVLVGEPIPRSIAEPWLRNGNVTLRNGYGQSEACSMNSTAVLSESSSSYRTIGNSTWLRYWIVDPSNHDRLMPVGGLGELVVEGHSVAQGYFEEPAKTAAAFIQSPAWAASFGAGTGGRRWYKTGDLVQYQENGELFLYGRKDAQLKIHGQRVEAAEIEHLILKAFDGNISQVVVDKIAESGAEIEKLIAFVQLRESVDALRNTSDRVVQEERERQVHTEMLDRLANAVPNWMIPARVILVKEMTRTATGKLDRRSLKEVHGKRLVTREVGTSKVETTTNEISDDQACQQEGISSEITCLSQIWSRVLKLQENTLNPNSHWAQAGGDSMTAMLLVRDAKAQGFHFTSADVLSGASLGELAAKSTTQRTDSLDPSSEAEQLNETSKHEFLIPTTDFQSHYAPEASSKAVNQLFKYKIAFRGAFDFEQIQQAIQVWFANIETLRIKFHRVESGKLVQSLMAKETTEWQQRIRAHESDEDVVSRSTQQDFLAHPVFVSLRGSSPLSKGGVDLVLHIHHSIFDGLSFDMMLDDLVEIYQGHKGAARPSYLDYVRGRFLKHDAESLDYWSGLLRDSMPTILRQRPEKLIATSSAQLSEHRTVSRIVYLQPSDERRAFNMSTVVHCAWSMVLGALSGKTDVMFLTLMHGRDEDVERSGDIIGCCVSECPVRIQCSDDMRFSDLIDHARRQIISSSNHAHLGANTIASKCTEWPLKDDWYQHSSFVLHQNVLTKEHMPVGDLGYLHVEHTDVEKVQMYDFDLYTKSADAGELSFELTYLEQLYSNEEANVVADAFTTAVRACVSGEGTAGSLRKDMAGLRSLPRVQ